MNKIYNIKQTSKDNMGKKTTISITTEDEKIVKGILETNVKTKNTKKSTKANNSKTKRISTVKKKKKVR